MKGEQKIADEVIAHLFDDRDLDHKITLRVARSLIILAIRMERRGK